MENRVERIFADEKNMPENERLLVSLILDESGSMEGCKTATISGFNEYISELKRRRGTIRMTLTKFDSSRIETVYADTAITDVVPLNTDTYTPGAATPLYDAIAQTIRDIPEDRENVLCIIMTDGNENASREHTKETVQKMIQEKEDKGWTFVYLGANQDSWSNAQSIGMSSMGSTSNYSANDAGIMNTFSALTRNTMCYSRRMETGTNFFSDEDKKSMQVEEEPKK